MEETAPESVTTFPLLYTGKTSGSLILVYDNNEEGEESGEQYVCGAVAQKGEGTLLWISAPESLGATAYSLSASGNFSLVYEALNWMTDNTYTGVSVSSTLMTTDGLSLDANGVTVLGVILILILPLAVIIPSSAYLYKRKKR